MSHTGVSVCFGTPGELQVVKVAQRVSGGRLQMVKGLGGGGGERETTVPLEKQCTERVCSGTDNTLKDAR